MTKFTVTYNGRDGMAHRMTVEADCEVNAIYRAFRDCPEDIRRRLTNIRCEEIPSMNLDPVRVLTRGVRV